MAVSSEPGVIAARPAISVAGQDRAALAEGLISLSVVEHCQGIYSCEATFGNWGAGGGGLGFLYFDRDLLDFGKAFAVRLGAASGAPALFEGRITGLEATFPEGGGPLITVLAEDRFQDLRMTRRTRSFERISDADVIRRVAAEHGLRADVDVPGPTHAVLAQVNQSDLAFLRERTRAVDAEIWMERDTLCARAHSGRGSGSVLTLTYGGELREFSVLADLAHQRSGVTVSGWNVAGKSQIKYEATDAAIRAELGGDLSGAAILGQALGGRKEALVHTVPLNAQEAEASANAYFRASARRFLTGRGTAQPDARLRVGIYVDLQKLGPLFSGRYYLAAVQHLFDDDAGLRSEFVAERPGLGRGSR